MAGLTSSLSPALFVHLHVHTDHSFGDGVSEAAEIALEVERCGQSMVAVTDTNRVSAIPGLVRACERAGIKAIAGCEIVLENETRLTLLADGAAGFRSLCRLLSLAGLRDMDRKGLRVRWDDMETCAEGLVCLTGSPERGAVPLLIRQRDYSGAMQYAKSLLALFGKGNLYVEVVRSLIEGERTVSLHLFELADALEVPVVATNAVRHATRLDYAAHEVLRRIGLSLPPGDEHGEMPLNAERFLKMASAMHGLFADRPDALRNAVELAVRLGSPLSAGVWHLPRFPDVPDGENAFSYLSQITWRGAGRRYDKPLPSSVRVRVIHELETIRDTGFSDYFLVCADICAEARRRGVRYALRGSAVGSAVAFCLGIGQHDPIRHGITFDRFLARHRRKPPDIDLDFQHNERDAMMEWTCRRYGPERVANIVNYVRWRGKSLLRDIGKALGHNTQEIEQLRTLLSHSSGGSLMGEIEARPGLRALGITRKRYEALFTLCAHLSGKVRHYGTHSSGIVISSVPVADVAPLLWAAKGVTVAAFDKDDIESDGIGLLKIDQLSLRSLSAIETAERSIRRGDANFDLRRRDLADAETFAMIREGKTVGVFQIESPAQMSLQQRFGSEHLGDLTQSVALIRPIPTLGRSVDDYIARRHGHQTWEYPLPELGKVLDETYGRIVYQDQVLDVSRQV